MEFESLRSTTPPFIPALDSELDTGYYDDFTSAEDMAKYAEVKEKQRNVDKVKEKDVEFGRGVWVGFTFGKNGPGVHLKGLAGESNLDDDHLYTIFWWYSSPNSIITLRCDMASFQILNDMRKSSM